MNILRLFVLLNSSPYASAACDTHALLSCQSELGFVSRSIGSGPEDSGHFQETNDGEGNFLCSAFASVDVPGTLLAAHASLDDLGAGKHRFALFVEQADESKNEPFQQLDANTIEAVIAAHGTPSLIFRGKTEKLATLKITCRYIP